MLLTDRPEPGLALDGYRLLVAEDEYLTADTICASIRDAGGEVVGPAASLEEAMRLASSEPIDAAVVDMGLEGGNAAPLIDLLLSETVPVVLATAAERDAIPRAHRHLRRLRKPYSVAMLIGNVLDALEQVPAR